MEDKKPLNDFEYIIDRLDSHLVAFAIVESEINLPTIIPNDQIALRKSEGYKPGDFVFYINANDYFVRRIIKIDVNKVYVKGDNEEMVYIILPEQVIAKAISLERGLKRISLVFIKNRMKVKFIIKKGLKYIKNNFIENDEYIMPTAEPVKKKKKEVKTVLPLDKKLQNELAHFKSVDEKVEEFYNPDLMDEEE